MSCTVEIEELDASSNISSVPSMQALWNDPDLLPQRGRVLALRTLRGSRVVAFWLVPIQETAEGIAAQRPCRLFPYAAPWLADSDALRRRTTVLRLISALQERVSLIDLPMAPYFREAGVATAAGCFVEWRHTHLMDRERWSAKGDHCFSPSARAHARRAEKAVRIVLSDDIAAFRFDVAVKGPHEVVVTRRRLALALQNRNRAIALSALDGHRECGGVLLVNDSDTVYLYHSWFDRNSPSGVPSLLIREAMRWAFTAHWCRHFDFEGSVLATVDAFMSGFGAEIVPYAHLYWAKSPARIISTIAMSLAIEGRSARRVMPK